MRQRNDLKIFEGGFVIVSESKTNQSRAAQRTEKWQGESDREKSLSVPRWSRRRKMITSESNEQRQSTTTLETIKDASEAITKAT